MFTGLEELPADLSEVVKALRQNRDAAGLSPDPRPRCLPPAREVRARTRCREGPSARAGQTGLIVKHLFETGCRCGSRSRLGLDAGLPLEYCRAMPMFRRLASQRGGRASMAPLIAFLLLTMNAGVAAGQSELPRAPVAEGLFQQGKASLEAGQVAEACAKFEESQRLDPALGTLLNLALCHERQGKLATAWSEWADAAAMAERSGELERLRFARDAGARLENRVPKLLIRVYEPAAGFELRIDGRPIGEAAWGVPIPLDPGVHRLDAAAPQRKSWARSFELVVGAAPFTLEVPRLEPMPALEPRSAPKPLPSRAAVAGSTQTRSRAHTTRRTWGYVTGAIGIAGFGAGTYFGLTTIAKQKIVDENCNSVSCRNEKGMTADRAAHRAATAATVSFGIGFAAALTSAYLLLTSGDDDTPEAATNQLEKPLLSAVEVSPRGARLEATFAF
jgi:hypothetical protein